MNEEEKKKFYWNQSYVRKSIPQGFFFNTAKIRGIFHFLCKYNFDGAKILSVGDGLGFFTYMCGLMWTGCKLMTTDYSETGPEKARELFSIISIIRVDVKSNLFQQVMAIFGNTLIASAVGAIIGLSLGSGIGHTDIYVLTTPADSTSTSIESEK